MARGARAAARAAACAEAYRTFPMLAGVEPTLERRGPNAIYTFRIRKSPADDPPSPMPIVRVTVDAEGKVLRVVASR